MAIASIILSLVTHDVEFIVVGGMAAVLQGAPVHTIDLDIVYALSDANISRLELALTELGAVFRDDPRKIVPNRSHLQSRGHKLLQNYGGAAGRVGDDRNEHDVRRLAPRQRLVGGRRLAFQSAFARPVDRGSNSAEPKTKRCSYRFGDLGRAAEARPLEGVRPRFHPRLEKPTNGWLFSVWRALVEEFGTAARAAA